jgi:hypothetical protein
MKYAPAVGFSSAIRMQPEVDIKRRQQLYREWRERWIGQGVRWKSLRELPAGWNAVRQLRNIGLEIKTKI